MSSLLFADLAYMGIKGCFYISKFVGIAGYNVVAYVGGYDRIDFFPPSKEQLLLMEVKNLKNELSEIKTLMKGEICVRQTPEYIYIDEQLPNNKKITFDSHDSIELTPLKNPLLIEYHDEDSLD